MYPEYWIPRAMRSGNMEIPRLRNSFFASQSSLESTKNWLKFAMARNSADYQEFFQVADQHNETDAFTALSSTISSLELQHKESYSDKIEELIDFTLFHTTKQEVIDEFNKLTSLSFINWKSSDSAPYQLQRRVLPEIQEHYLSLNGTLVNGSPKAARYLQDAWANAYGRETDPQKAWENAYNLVEETVGQLLKKLNISRPSLGKYIGTLRNQKKLEVEIHLPVSREPGGTTAHTPLDQLLNLLELITYQYGRHPDDLREPTLKLARSQVNIAMAIAQIVEDGAIEVHQTSTK